MHVDTAPMEGTRAKGASRWANEEERYRDFAAAIDAIRDRVHRRVGKEDVAYIKRVRSVSRALEIASRSLIHFSLEPLSFGCGVILLWLHKQLETGEIGHTVLHGAFDRLEGAEAFRSTTFVWEFPIDEQSWRYGHNIRHHQYTNIAGKDPDIHFAQKPVDDGRESRFMAIFRLPLTLGLVFPNLGFVMNARFTGLIDLYLAGGANAKFDFIRDRSLRSVAAAHWRALRKSVPHFVKNYVCYPALAGPFFWKVLLGNWLAGVLRNVFTAASVYCGHVGDDVPCYGEGARARSRGEWYAMQVEATNNFDVPWLLSALCGALDRQIEHHLFPRLPTNRLREISAEVRTACEKHGVLYRSAPWPATLAKVLRHIWSLQGAPSPPERA